MLRRVSQKGSCLSTDLIPRQAHQRGWVFRGKSMGNIPRGEAWRLDSGKAKAEALQFWCCDLANTQVETRG